MALSRVTTWTDQQVLTHSALNGEIDNILNNPMSLISPLTANLAAGGFDITGVDELGFTSAGSDASATNRLRANGVNLTWHDGSAAGRLFYAGGTDVPVADGGTGLSSGKSGGLLCFTGLTTITSTATLSAGEVVVGMGAGVAPAGLTLTDGQVIIGRTGASPSAASLTGGANVTITEGSGSITIAATALTPVGTGYKVQGATASCATGTTVITAAADYIQLYHPNTATASIWAAPATASVDGSVQAGQTQTGRDQVGAFTSGSWVHLYWIASGTTPVLILSANPPRGGTATLSGPTLPTGFINWAYHGTFRWNSGGAFDGMDQEGAKVYWRATPLAVDGGTATSDTAVSVAGYVPPPHVGRRMILGVEAAANSRVLVGYRSGQRFFDVSSSGGLGTELEMPNQSQQFFYSRGGAHATNISVLGYVVMNGDS